MASCAAGAAATRRPPPKSRCCCKAPSRLCPAHARRVRARGFPLNGIAPVLHWCTAERHGAVSRPSPRRRRDLEHAKQEMPVSSLSRRRFLGAASACAAASLGGLSSALAAGAIKPTERDAL